MENLGPWKVKGILPVHRKGHTMTRLLDSPHVIVFGGENEHGDFLNDLHLLNLETATWSPIIPKNGPSPKPRILHTATAISATTIVVFGGDCLAPSQSLEHPALEPVNDTWSFDLSTLSWTPIAENDSNTPSPRAGHTAVLCHIIAHHPAIYVFGGFHTGGRPGSVVYRLRLSDWCWEPLSVLVHRPDGADMITTDPSTALANLPHDDNTQPLYPYPREAHAAIWSQALNAMVLMGGEGHTLFNDCWLFSTVPKQPTWQWRRLPLRTARGSPTDLVPGSSGMTVIPLPLESPCVLIWGGINGADEINDIRFAHILQLKTGFSSRVPVSGPPMKCGGVLVGFALYRDKIIFHDGCDGDSEIKGALDMARVLPTFQATTPSANDFGTEAGLLAVHGKTELANGENVTKEAKTPLISESLTIQSGKEMDCRIIAASDLGFFVSTVMDGKLFKGLLVKTPACKDGKKTFDENGKAATEEMTNTVADEADKTEATLEEPRAKKPRLDPAVEALPDEPDERPQPIQAALEEVITLD